MADTNTGATPNLEDLLTSLTDLVNMARTSENFDIAKVLRQMARNEKNPKKLSDKLLKVHAKEQTAKLALALDKAILEQPKISHKAFKKAATLAWRKAQTTVTDDATGATEAVADVNTIKKSKYHEFMKETLPRMRLEFPNEKSTAYMGMVAKAWREKKATVATVATVATGAVATEETETETETVTPPVAIAIATDKKVKANKKAK